MNNLIEDLSIITTIPRITLEQLMDKCNNIICHAVYETYIKGDVHTCIDVGLGKLSIVITEEGILYKFIPTETFEESIHQTILSKKSPLTKAVEEGLVSRIETARKELF